MEMDIPVLQGKDVDRFEPLGSFVLIQRIDEAVDKVGSIHVPEIARVQSNQGRVVAVGEGRIIGGQIVPIPLKKGDVVLFSKYGAEEIKLDGEDFLLLRYDEIKLRERMIALVS